MAKTNRKPLPFHQDLGGYERVTRAFARKAWSWGIPVWQDAGQGAKLLPKPTLVQERDLKKEFDKWCLGLGPWNVDHYIDPFLPKYAKQCTYLIKWGPMTLHFQFEDGSNPFVKHGLAAELIYELSAWNNRYFISPRTTGDPKILAYSLREKFPAAKGLFAPGP